MNLRVLNFVIILVIVAAGCSGPETPSNSAANTNTGNSGQQAGNTENPLGTTKKPEVPTVNEAPTLTPVFRAYCEALLKKDNAALRAVFSAETLKVLEKDSAEEKSSLVEYLAELDRIKDAKQCVARNEKLDGTVGIAELKSESMPQWVAMEFHYEGGTWKLTNKSPDFTSVKDAAVNSDSAR